MPVEVTLAEIVRRPVRTVGPDEPVGAAAELLDTEGIGSVIVVEDGRPVGIVTDTDVVALFAADIDRSTPVRSVMTTPLITVGADATVAEAADLMRENEIDKLPVREDGEDLAGIVTTTDLSNYIPTLLHPAEAPELSERRRRTRPETAYEDDDWAFESYGQEDGIDVGDSVTFAKTVDADDVAAFADASGDTNRLHLDEEFAAGTRFGRQIVHGTLVAGTISAALARLPGLTIYLSQEVTYTAPVDVGARVRAHCEVIEQLGEDRFRLSTAVDADGEPVIEGQAVVLSDPIPESA